MNRQRLIDHLRILYAENDTETLGGILSDITRSGELHDPEFCVCIFCGNEYEHYLAAKRPSSRCRDCDKAERGSTASASSRMSRSRRASSAARTRNGDVEHAER